MSDDDLESLRETLFWLQQSGIRGDLAKGEQEYDAGETLNAEELRARYGLPPL
jgi:antitoxin YefM